MYKVGYCIQENALIIAPTSVLKGVRMVTNGTYVSFLRICKMIPHSTKKNEAP